MRLHDGGVDQITGRLLIGNDLPLVFIPLDRLHLYENANSGFNAIRFQNTLTGTTGNDGYRTGISNTNRDVLHTQFENRPIRWELPTTDLTGLQEWMRIQHGGTVSFANNTNGYIGLNNTNVRFHIDGRTSAASNAGELFLSFRLTDVYLWGFFYNLFKFINKLLVIKFYQNYYCFTISYLHLYCYGNWR
jgi:hypothetical protein